MHLFDIRKSVKFQLYTLKNPTEPQILLNNDLDSITFSNYDPKLPTRMIIHGWLSHGEFRAALTEGMVFHDQ